MTPTITGVPLSGVFQLESNRQIYATEKGPKPNSQTKRPFLKSGFATHFHSSACIPTIGCRHRSGLLLCSMQLGSDMIRWAGLGCRYCFCRLTAWPRKYIPYTSDHPASENISVYCFDSHHPRNGLVLRRTSDSVKSWSRSCYDGSGKPYLDVSAFRSSLSG